MWPHLSAGKDGNVLPLYDQKDNQMILKDELSSLTRTKRNLEKKVVIALHHLNLLSLNLM